jgi:uncharacterized protein HemX
MSYRRVIVHAALLAAVALGAVAPGGTRAQTKQRKEPTRITAEQRKAAAEARKVKMEEARRLHPEVHGTSAPKSGGAR